MKLTKIKIEQMANEIMEFLKKEKLDTDVLIYFNNKRMDNKGINIGEYDPHDYFEYANYNHILSMSFEGAFYRVVNYYENISYCDRIMEKFNDILEKYGVYKELGNSWNLTCSLIDDNTEVEYAHYNIPKERIRIYDINDDTVPTELRAIGRAWREFQAQVGDQGSCVLGAGFEFDYKDQPYFLTPCSLYQGSISWETNKDTIKMLLEVAGATNIRYNWGIMD